MRSCQAPLFKNLVGDSPLLQKGEGAHYLDLIGKFKWIGKITCNIIKYGLANTLLVQCWNCAMLECCKFNNNSLTSFWRLLKALSKFSSTYPTPGSSNIPATCSKTSWLLCLSLTGTPSVLKLRCLPYCSYCSTCFNGVICSWSKCFLEFTFSSISSLILP